MANPGGHGHGGGHGGYGGGYRGGWVGPGWGFRRVYGYGYAYPVTTCADAFVRFVLRSDIAALSPSEQLAVFAEVYPQCAWWAALQGAWMPRNAGQNETPAPSPPPASTGPSMGQIAGTLFIAGFAWFAISSSKQAERESGARLAAARARGA